ncbi:MAG: DNA repair protein RecN [Bacteroidota bacterium]
MIKWLKIKNFAIIEELELEFSAGLTIITGETGAGKSILLGALGLLMGRRMDTKSLHDESKKCVIEGAFDVSKHELKDIFERHDIDYEDELLIRRELTPSGKSRAFANDTPTNLKVLQELSSHLLDLHQQFDTQDLNTADFQIQMLDALAGNKKILKNYRQAFKAYRQNRRILQDLIERQQRELQESDFLKFQLNELNEAALEVEEQTKLETEAEQLTHAEDIKRNLNGVFQHLSEADQSVLNQMQTLALSVGSVSEFDPKVNVLKARFDSLILELEDLTKEFEAIAEDTEYDGARLQEVNERLDLIYRLQKKHQVQSIGELLEIRRRLEGKQSSFSDLEENIASLEQEIEQQEKYLFQQAKNMSERRQKIAPKFQQKVEKMLHELSMQYAQMHIQFEHSSQLLPLGIDQVEYLFAANKGSKLQPIRAVASGGEQSRLALATKSLVASAIPLPTMIFDEIDTGISGHVALKMGEILRKLSDEHQVVSITHSPQVASKANTHYFIYKKIKNDRTITRVKQLNSDEKVRAIAVMLSSNPPSESAMQNARELLGFSDR